VAGRVTSLLGMSGAEIQISALMLRCRVPPRIAVGTGTAAAVVTLAAAVVLITVQGRVAWPLVAVSAPAAALGARASRVVATHLPQEAMRRGIGVIMLCSAVELGIRRVLL
jgi:uncharacterized membrane protein YfcA